MPPKIKESECVGCGACESVCPQGVLKIVGGVSKVVKPAKCIECWACMGVCPLGLIEKGKAKKGRKKQ